MTEISNNEIRKVPARTLTAARGAPKEGGLLLIDSRKLIRQCFEECFRQSPFAGQVLAIADVAEWSGLAADHPAPAVVFLHLPANASPRTEIEKVSSALAGQDPAPPVVVMSDNENPAHVLEALEAGARGYVPSSVSLEVAVEALRLVLAGGAYVPASALIASRNMGKDVEDSPERSPNAMFTDRQFAVIERLREGKANKIIAYELNMRESTVKVHIRNIMRKLRATNRTQVAYLYHSMLSGAPAGARPSEPRLRQSGD